MSERFGTLRSILQETPSEGVWLALFEELNLWGEEERERVALPYVLGCLRRWPPTIKRWAMSHSSPAWGLRLSNMLVMDDVGLMRALLEDAAWVEGCRHLEVKTPEGYEALAGHLERFDQLISLSVRAHMMDEETMVSLLSRAWPPSLRELSVEGLGAQRSEARSVIMEALARNESFVGLETLRLSDGRLDAAQLKTVAQSPVLSRVRKLILSSNEMNAASVRVLGESEHLGRLEELDVSRCEIDAAGAGALASSALLETVARLDVSRNPLRMGLAALLDSPHTRALTALELDSVVLDVAGAQALCGVTWPPGLEALELKGTSHWDGPIFDALADAPILRLLKHFMWYGKRANRPTKLMASPHLTGLRSLELFHADTAVMAAARNPALRGLESLMIHTKRLNQECVAALSRSALANNLSRFVLNAQHPGIGALFDARSWGRLRSLTLSGLTRGDGITETWTAPTITDEDVERLARSEVLGRLEVLTLDKNLLSDMAALALAGSGRLAGLRELDLRENKIGRAGVMALLRGLPPDALEDGLNLHGNPLTHEDIIALAAEPALANLRGRLWIGATDEREETWQALIDSPYASAPTRDQAKYLLERLHDRRRTT